MCWHVQRLRQVVDAGSSAWAQRPEAAHEAGNLHQSTREGREGQMRRTCDPRDASPSQACVDLRSAVGMIAGHIFVGLASSPSGVVSNN